MAKLYTNSACAHVYAYVTCTVFEKAYTLDF